MKSNTKKIVLGILFAGVLYSCNKEEMTVEKNNDLKWSVDKKIENDDIRTRIGYDPRTTYAVLDRTKVDFSVPVVGKTLLQGEKQSSQLTLELTNPATKDVKILLQYDASLYQKIKPSYLGYELGEESVLEVQKEIVIKAGEKKASIALALGNLTEAKQVVLPYSLKVEGEEVKIFNEDLSFFTVVVSFEKDLGKVLSGAISLADSSEQFRTTFAQLKEENQTKNNETLQEKFYLWYLERTKRTGIIFYSTAIWDGKPYNYETVHYVTIGLNDNNQVVLKKEGGDNYFNAYYKFLQPMVDLITGSPYNVEALSGNKIKLTSANDSSVWFVIQK